jgi:hypothetical protein
MRGSLGSHAALGGFGPEVRERGLKRAVSVGYKLCAWERRIENSQALTDLKRSGTLVLAGILLGS